MVVTMSRTCSIEGCDKRHEARGWCESHYQRWKKHGDPLGGGPPKKRSTSPVCSIEDCTRPSKSHGWCNTHYERWRKYGDVEFVHFIKGDRLKRFWSYVDQSGGPDACWPWTGNVTDSGYALFHHEHKAFSAHRYAYQLMVGEISDGLVLDHICHKIEHCRLAAKCPHRRCCNPAHLKPRPQRENALRGHGPTAINAFKDECVNGHPFDEANTYFRPGGGRSCRTCMRERMRRIRKRKRLNAQVT